MWGGARSSWERVVVGCGEWLGARLPHMKSTGQADDTIDETQAHPARPTLIAVQKLDVMILRRRDCACHDAAQ